MPSNTFSLFSQPYLDRVAQCYLTIITTNTMPAGPLGKHVVRVKMSPLSEFDVPGECESIQMCGLALMSPSRCGLIDLYELPDLFSFLETNGYSVNESITNILKENDGGKRKTLAFVRYNPA